jgi:hypothetical protein
MSAEVCDACQACGVGDLSETITLLAEGEASLGRPAGEVLVAIEDDLSTERRIARHFDGYVPHSGSQMWKE